MSMTFDLAVLFHTVRGSRTRENNPVNE
jgi:hypothetical protein